MWSAGKGRVNGRDRRSVPVPGSLSASEQKDRTKSEDPPERAHRSNRFHRLCGLPMDVGAMPASGESSLTSRRRGHLQSRTGHGQKGCGIAPTPFGLSIATSGSSRDRRPRFLGSLAEPFRTHKDFTCPCQADSVTRFRASQGPPSRRGPSWTRWPHVAGRCPWPPSAWRGSRHLRKP